MQKADRNHKITIVGAGPVGSLLALYLARRGIEVEILERRPDMRKEAIPAGRSINLAVSLRGLYALHDVGLREAILEQAIPMKGRMIHSREGELAFQPYGKDETEFINSMSRGELNKTLMTAAEATGLVSIRFNQMVLDMDFEGGLLTVEEGETGTTYEHKAAVAIAADGSASAVRDAMARLPGYKASEEELDYGYKELSIPPAPGGGFLIERNALHIWPRGSYMLIALPNFDGSFTCTLFLPFEGPVSFRALATRADVTSFFREQFADAVPLLENLEDTFFSNPTGHMVTVKCRPWHVDGKALLMGDAAHSIVPFFGQGMNCGFEDCTVLDRILEGRKAKGGYDWEGVFQEFFTARKENTDAIADMAVENFIEMRDKVADPKFLMGKAVEKILQNAFPGRYVSRYSLVTFSRVPYRLALDAGAVTDEILSELCRDIERAEDVDLGRAERLIDEKLAPLLRGHEKELSGSASPR